MAKFYGLIGFIKLIETTPGVYEETIIEKNYAGDVIRNSRRWESADKINDNLVINNQFSIISDSFATENFQTMRYVKWNGSAWKITNIEVQRPRLILTIGGIYNGKKN
jgi:hypothetical protein